MTVEVTNQDRSRVSFPKGKTYKYSEETGYLGVYDERNVEIAVFSQGTWASAKITE